MAACRMVYRSAGRDPGLQDHGEVMDASQQLKVLDIWCATLDTASLIFSLTLRFKRLIPYMLRVEHALVAVRSGGGRKIFQ